MMNIPNKKELPQETVKLLESSGIKSYIVIRPCDRVNTKKDSVEFSACADISVNDNSVFVSLYNENSPQGALITKCMWFGKCAEILVILDNKAYLMRVIPYKLHASGGILNKKIKELRLSGTAQDIACVWEMYFDSIKTLKKIPAGDFTEKQTDFFEMHLDNPSVIKK